MKLIRTFLIACILLLMAGTSFAVHIKGGWMYYELVRSAGGESTYKIVVKLYRDCAVPNPGQNDAAINISFFRNDNNEQLPTVRATQTDMYRLEKQSFSNCINPKPFVCYVILEYTATITLPDISAGYTAAFQRCCRVDRIVNVAQPSNTFGNTYTITIPGTKLDASFPQNSSPKFVEKDTVAICYNSPFQLDYGAFDPDGDSLVYEFTSALNGGSASDPVPVNASVPPYNSIPYGAFYTADNPFGTNVKINPKTGLISGTSPGTTGEYVLAVMLREYRNGKLLAETRKELHVNVAACNLISAQLPTRINSCDGYTVEFENLSTSPAINTYYWDFGDNKTNTDTSTQPKPVYTYADTGVYIAKLVVNRNANCSDSTTTEVRVFPGFFPDFDITGSCVTNPFRFTDKSSTRYGQIDSYHWDFGDPTTLADSSLLANPNYKYNQLGTYPVGLIVTSSKGCIDTLVKDLIVLDKPVLELPFTDTLICSIDSLKLLATGNGIFSWSPALRIINANTASPTVFPIVTSTYTVTLNDQGCFTSGTVKVNVLDSVTVFAGNDTTICLTDGITFRPISQALGFSWTPAATLSDPNIKNPVATPVAANTTYTVTARLGKCTATDDITIRTIPYPQVNAGADTAICFGDSTLLRGTSNGSTFRWTPAATLANPTSLTTLAYPKQTTDYILSVTDIVGCPKPAFDTVNIRVIPPIQVFAGNDTNLVIGQPLQLNGVANSTNYQWSPAFGLSNSTIANPVLTVVPNSMPDSDEFLKYILTVSSPEGCTSFDEIIVRVFRTEPSIFIPNAFTPNGDGNNDIIRPILAGMKELSYFRIYNRYGQLLYETRQQGAGWDGRVKGEMQSSNAFVFDCQAVSYTGRPVRLKGSFVLIR